MLYIKTQTNKSIFLFALFFTFLPLQIFAGSVSVEGDAAAYFLNGYSGIVRKSFDNGLDLALGGGAFNMPHTVVESTQLNNNLIQWEARVGNPSILFNEYQFPNSGWNGSLHVGFEF